MCIGAALVMVNPSDVILVPRDVRSSARLREFVQLEELQRQHPLYELFILWFRQDVDTFAVVMRISKELVAKHGWPLIVDPESRVVQFNKPSPEAADE